MKRAPSGKPILNKPDVDGLYTCQYTGLKVSYEDAIFLGPCIPQVNGTYVCHPTAPPFFKQSKRRFDESEANCNTCKHLVRVKHEPRKDGQLQGKCHIMPALLFHPDDSMGMNCYEQRPEKNMKDDAKEMLYEVGGMGDPNGRYQWPAPPVPFKMEGGIPDPDVFTWSCACDACKARYTHWKNEFDRQQKQLKEPK